MKSQQLKIDFEFHFCKPKMKVLCTLLKCLKSKNLYMHILLLNWKCQQAIDWATSIRTWYMGKGVQYNMYTDILQYPQVPIVCNTFYETQNIEIQWKDISYCLVQLFKNQYGSTSNFFIFFYYLMPFFI